jgi:hydrogenase/urease accessory protein HupE
MIRRDGVEHLSARALPAIGISILVGVGLVLLPIRADAHAVGLSRGDYRLTAQGVDVSLVLARAEVTAAMPSLASARGEIARGTFDQIRVTTSGEPCVATLMDARLTEQDGLELRARYVCPPRGENLLVELPILDELSHGHRHAAHVTTAVATSDHLLFRQQSTFSISRSPGDGGSADRAATVTWSGFVRMGIEHILTGYDHLLFLFALVLGGGTMRSHALAITSFTAAHSVTLGLAVLGFVVPPARWIEPAIALSVAYVGIENLFAKRIPRHWITFPFGLVHGFGFAGALGEIDIPRGEVPSALLSFNVGVELGQLTWMISIGLLMMQLRRRTFFGRRGVPVLSAVIAVIGLVWFAGRLTDSASDFRGVACANPSCG